jgi:UDP-N-acetylglucosamine 2-epimerase
MSAPVLEHDPASVSSVREPQPDLPYWLAKGPSSAQTRLSPHASLAPPGSALLICVGTRPEIIKMAPVYRALRAREVSVRWLHTGQHDDMAWPLYEFFAIKPDHVIKLERKNDSLSELSARLLCDIDSVIGTVPAAGVLVHGDTTSAAMGALAAFYRSLPVAHVEAGLRSNHPTEPFPEEMNRRLIGRLARWHFAPTERARVNLLREAIDDEQVFVVGNTIVDATRQALAALKGHNAVVALLAQEPELNAVWPLHANPRVGQTVRDAITRAPSSVAARIRLTEPLPYPQMVQLMADSWLLLTDSGGIQEEACALHIPVLVLRDTTERPELIEAGGGLMVGTSTARIVSTVRALLHENLSYRTMSAAPNPFGDGQSAVRIAAVMDAWLNPGAHQQVAEYLR